MSRVWIGCRIVTADQMNLCVGKEGRADSWAFRHLDVEPLIWLECVWVCVCVCVCVKVHLWWTWRGHNRGTRVHRTASWRPWPPWPTSVRRKLRSRRPKRPDSPGSNSEASFSAKLSTNSVNVHQSAGDSSSTKETRPAICCRSHRFQANSYLQFDCIDYISWEPINKTIRIACRVKNDGRNS